MCIAIYKPAGKVIPKETLQTCYNANSDGAGFMYVKNKQLHIQKGFFSFNEFYNEYQKHESKQAVLHFRIKTHGAVSHENCHPFTVNKSLAFVHNGIISGFGSDAVSDTRDFGKHILEPLVAKWGNLAIFQPAVKQLIESRIGYSKLIFLDRHGNVDIFNEQKGVWDNGIWYSNTSYIPVKPWVSRASTYGTSCTTTFKSYESYSYKPSKLSNRDKPAEQLLKEGDFVELTKAHWDNDTKNLFKIGDVLEVVSVNSDYTADCMTEDGAEFIYNIPFYKLDEAQEEDEETPIDAAIIPFDYYNEGI